MFEFEACGMRKYGRTKESLQLLRNEELVFNCTYLKYVIHIVHLFQHYIFVSVLNVCQSMSLMYFKLTILILSEFIT